MNSRKSNSSHKQKSNFQDKNISSKERIPKTESKISAKENALYYFYTATSGGQVSCTDKREYGTNGHLLRYL